MAATRRISLALASGMLGLAVAACSSSPSLMPAGSGGGASAGGGGTGGGPSQAATTATAPGVSQGTTGGGGGSTADICKVITTADVRTLLGKSVTANGPSAGEPQSCSWYSDDLTNVYLYRTTASECDDTRTSLTGTISVPGADFAGPDGPLDATFAGKVSNGACYVLEVSPTERAPQPDAIGQLLQTFLQKMGA